MKFFTANTFTPILNTKEFSSVFGGENGFSIPLNKKGFIQAMESVALPGTQFQGKATNRKYILEVETKEYPYKGPFFVDSRFLSVSTIERTVKLPLPLKILQTLTNLLGNPYFWGGNCLGIEELLSFYPPHKKLEKQLIDQWTLKGFDCSGLIYYASDGYTPRNTSSWLCFGEPVEIEGESTQGIISALKPLDAIVWNGHILFVYDENRSIESIVGEGVVLKNLKNRIESLLEEGKKPRNTAPKECSSYFLVRRWYPKKRIPHVSKYYY